MKQLGLVCTILLFNISLKLTAQIPPDASITFSNSIEEDNISLVVNSNVNAEAYTVLSEKDATGCLYIPTNKYGYFKVDDNTIRESDNNLIIRITYFDEGFGTLAFQYNAINDVKYERQNIKKTGSDTWVTTTLSITNAAFRNAQNNSADFRINGDNYIHKITISKGEMNPENEAIPATTGSSYSEFKEKSVAGYQAWFTASDNNSGWVHWSGNTRPAPGNSSFEIYPDVREYSQESLSPTGFANLGNGNPAEVFTSAEVIEAHFKWMQEYGIDGVALQRFIGDNPYPVTDSQLAKPIRVKNAAEKYQRIFYVCYDMSSGNDENAWVESIKFDWVYNIEQNYKLTSSPSYATVNNKPVVQIWGPGFSSRVGNSAGTIELIEFLQSRGCYVIGGVPTGWRTESRDSKTNFLNAYKTYDMVSPWTPGRYKTSAEADKFRTDYIEPDKAFCDDNNMDYMPVLFPGFAWSTWNDGEPNHIPRNAGNFLWRQAYNIKLAGVGQMYFAMFDEYDEGTAIMKAATDWSMIPTDYYFLTLSTDGTWVSSDFYLRVAGAATSMLKNPESPEEMLDVAHSEGPVYYRNSFEKRYTEWERNGVKGNGYFNLDPCFYKNMLLDNNNVLSAECTIVNELSNAKSGEYAIKVSGMPNSSENATFDYKIAEVEIPVVEDLKLSFWKKTENELGKYLNLDLIFESGKRLNTLNAYTDQNGKSMHPSVARGTINKGYQQFVCELGKDELLGDKISQIVVSYNKAANNDNFLAFFDNILISTEELFVPTAIETFRKENSRIYSSDKNLYFRELPLSSEVIIYDISGVAVKKFELNSNQIPVQLPNGIYLVSVISKNTIYTQKVAIINQQ